MTDKAQIKALVEHYRISQEGHLSEEEYFETFDNNDLIACYDDIIEAVDIVRPWIRKFLRRMTVNKAASTKVLCIRAETETGRRISSGVMIVSCLLEDVIVHRNRYDAADAFTNLSFKLRPDDA